MQKKTITSLMVLPLAFSAFADITLPDLQDPTGWSSNLTLGDNYNFNKDDNSVVINVGVGELTQTLTLPKGNYTLRFSQLDNVKVSITGSVLKKDIEGTTSPLSFEVTSKGAVVITLSCADPSLTTWSFAGSTIELVCDFDGIYDRLMAQLEGVAPIQPVVASCEGYPVFATMKQEYDGLITEGNEVKAQVEALKGTDVDELIRIYEEYGLINPTNNTLTANVTAYKNAVTAYNGKKFEGKDVTAWNTAYTSYIKPNLDASAALRADISSYRSRLAAAWKACTDFKSDYVTAQCQAEYNRLTGVINAYETEVNTAYATPVPMDELIEFNPTTNVGQLASALTAFQAKVDLEISNVKAVATAQTVVNTELLPAYTTAANKLNVIKGISGYADNYEDWKVTLTAEITKVYNDLVALYPTSPEGAAAMLAAAEAEKEEKIAEMNRIADNAIALANAQNQIMTDALAAIAAQRQRFAAFDANKVQKMNQNVRDAYAAAQEEFGVSQGKLEAAYAARTLVTPAASYAADITEKIDAFEFLFNNMTDIQKAYDNAVKDVKKTLTEEFTAAVEAGQVTGEVKTLVEEFMTKFDFASLQAQIDNLGADQDAYDQLMNDITYQTTIARDFVHNYIVSIEAMKSITSFNPLAAYVAEVNVDNKLYKASALAGVLASSYNELAAQVEDWQVRYETGLGSTGQTAFIAFQVIATEYVDKATFDGRVLSAARAVGAEVARLQKAANDSKYIVVKGVTDAAQASGTIYGVAEYYTKYDNLMASAQAAIPSGANLASTLSGYRTAGADYTSAWEILDGLQHNLPRLVANYNAYTALTAQYSAFETWRQSAQAAVNAMQAGAGRDWFQSVVDGKVTAFNTLKSNIQSALEKGLDTPNCADNQQLFQSQLDALKAYLYGTNGTNSTIRLEIRQETEAHASQMEAVNNARVELQNIIDQVQNSNSEGEHTDVPAEQIAEWLDQLNELLDSFAGIERSIYNNWAAGKSYSTDAQIKDAISGILTSANDVLVNFQGQIAVLNNALIGDEWQSLIAEAQQLANLAVSDYNQFYYGLTNENLRDYLSTALGSHQSIYNWSSRIKDLQDNAKAYVQAQSAAGKLISADYFDANYTEVVDGYKTDIEDQWTALINDVYSETQTYYGQKIASGKANVADIKSVITGAGFNTTSKIYTDNVNPRQTAVTAAETTYATINAKVAAATGANIRPARIEFVLAMDGVADNLDIANSAVNYSQVALGYRNDGLTEIADLRAKMTGYTDALESDQEYWLGQLAAAEQNVRNEASAGVNKNTFAGYVAAINSYMTAARNAEKALRDLNNAVKKGDELYQQYNSETGAKYNDLKNQLDNLLDQVGDLAFADHELQGVKNALDALSTYVESATKANPLTQNGINQYVNDFNTAVNAARTAAMRAELDGLRARVEQTKLAWNEASAASDLSTEQLDAYRDGINAVLAFVDGYNPNQSPYNNWVAFVTAAHQHESDLAAIYQALRASWTQDGAVTNPDQDPAGVVVAALQQAYASVEGFLNQSLAAFSGYEEVVRDRYQEQYDALAAELAAVPGQWEAEGARVIYVRGEYEKALSAIRARIAALNNQAAAYQTNEVRYNQLLEQLQAYEQRRDAILTLAAEYDRYVYMSDVNYYLEQALEDLNQRHEDESLTAGSQLNFVNDVKTLLDNKEVELNYNITAGNFRNTVRTNLNRTWTAIIFPYVVPQAREEAKEKYYEYDSKLSDHMNTANYILNMYVNGYYDEDNVLHRWTAAYAVQQFEALRGQIDQLNTTVDDLYDFVKDNTFTPGVVNGEGTEVNVQDVQLIITWVGEGMTFERLEEEKGAVVAYAADLNRDYIYNVADVTAVINLAMDFRIPGGIPGTNAPSRQIKRMPTSDLYNQGSIGMMLLDEADGLRRYAVTLDCAAQLAAGQLDIKLPAGAVLENVELTARANGHELYRFDNAEGARVVIASMENAAFTGTEGEIVILEVRGGEPSVSNVVFADSSSNTYHFGGISGTTFIDSLYEGASRVKEAIYDAAGRMMRSVQRGFNIIRNSDGTTTKEYKK